MTTEQLRRKCKQHLDDTHESLRSVARRAGFGKSTLSDFLLGKEIPRIAERKIARAVDPLRQDLDAQAHKVCLSLKRKYFEKDDP
jgi:lambda repressor-like predicted transcriptional regulator